MRFRDDAGERVHGPGRTARWKGAGVGDEPAGVGDEPAAAKEGMKCSSDAGISGSGVDGRWKAVGGALRGDGVTGVEAGFRWSRRARGGGTPRQPARQSKSLAASQRKDDAMRAGRAQ